MERVTVLGSNSPTGSHCVSQLLDRGCKVVGMSRSPEYRAFMLPYLYKKQRPEQFAFHQLDINKDITRIMEILDKFEPDTVINLSAQGEVQHSWDHPEHWFQTNTLGVVRLGNSLKGKRYMRKFVQVSTPEVYGTSKGFMQEDLHYYNPSTPYAASKAAGDMFLLTLFKNFQFPLVLTRSSNVYGIHQQLYRIIPRTIIYLKMGKTIELHGGGHAVKSFIHLRDAADGIIRTAELGKPGEVYHFSPDGGGVAVRDVVRMICDRMGHDFQKATRSVGERLGQDAKYTLDSTKARTGLGWKQTVMFEDGISETIQWIEENWNEVQKMPLEYVHKE